MANGETFKKITEYLEAPDGQLTIQQRDGFLLAAMRDIYDRITSMDNKIEKLFLLEKRIEALERKNIIMWAERHPKLALMVAVLLLTAINLWFVSDFRKAILLWLGLSPDLVP